MTNLQDPLQRLEAYRPDLDQLRTDWDPAQVRASVAADRSQARLRLTLRRVPINASLLTAATIVALIVGVLAVVAGSGGSGGGDDPAAGADPHPFVVGSVVATPRVGPGQFAYREQTVYQIASDGSATEKEHGGIWAAPDGSLWYSGDISAAGCLHANAPAAADTGSPTQAWFDAMPTTGAALTSYLRGQVNGSSSADEALFVAVGDMLRNTDLLATSELRAAAVSMLSTLPGITVHDGATDYRGRASVRVDWVNQALRPGEVSSLYFDASTFQLLEERDGASGAPATYNGPSPAYTAGATDGPTGEQLSNPSGVTVTGVEKVVDSVPADVVGCPTH